MREEGCRKSPAGMAEVAGEAVAEVTAVEVAAKAVAAETAEERGRPDTKHPLAEAPTG